MGANVLDVVQSTLDSRGLKDVKFFFCSSVQDYPQSDVAKDVAHILETYLEGHHTPLLPFGDSKGCLSTN